MWTCFKDLLKCGSEFQESCLSCKSEFQGLKPKTDDAKSWDQIKRPGIWDE